MSDRTIPEASQDEFSSALRGLHTQAKAHGVDTSSHDVNAFLAHVAEVEAQSAAEIRWLRNLLNNEGKNNDV